MHANYGQLAVLDAVDGLCSLGSGTVSRPGGERDSVNGAAAENSSETGNKAENTNQSSGQDQKRREVLAGCLRELVREVVQCNFDTAQF